MPSTNFNDSSSDRGELDTAVVRILTFRLVPFLFLLYIVAYLDRINLGFAALQMQRQLGFTDSMYGLGAGIFFAGYFLFQVPSNLVLARVGARRWIAVLMVMWGIVSASMCMVTGVRSFYTLRFLLGRGGSRLLSGSHSLFEDVVPGPGASTYGGEIHDCSAAFRCGGWAAFRGLARIARQIGIGWMAVDVSFGGSASHCAGRDCLDLSGRSAGGCSLAHPCPEIVASASAAEGNDRGCAESSGEVRSKFGPSSFFPWCTSG